MTRDNDPSINDGAQVRASFVIRCSFGNGQQVRARLLDVRTGREYPFSDLNMLPEMLEGLLKPLVYAQECNGTRSEV